MRMSVNEPGLPGTAVGRICDELDSERHNVSPGSAAIDRTESEGHGLGALAWLKVDPGLGL